MKPDVLKPDVLKPDVLQPDIFKPGVLWVYLSPTKRQVTKRQVSQRPVSKRVKRQAYKMSVRQNNEAKTVLPFSSCSTKNNNCGTDGCIYSCGYTQKAEVLDLDTSENNIEVKRIIGDHHRKWVSKSLVLPACFASYVKFRKSTYLFVKPCCVFYSQS